MAQQNSSTPAAQQPAWRPPQAPQVQAQRSTSTPAGGMSGLLYLANGVDPKKLVLTREQAAELFHHNSTIRELVNEHDTTLLGAKNEEIKNLEHLLADTSGDDPNGPKPSRAYFKNELWHTKKNRDAVVKERDAAVKERDAAIKERDAAIKERDAAIKEGDDAKMQWQGAVKHLKDADKALEEAKKQAAETDRKKIEMLRRITAQKDEALEKLQTHTCASTVADVSKMSLTEEQAREILSHNQSLQAVMRDHTKKDVDTQTRALQATIATQRTELEAAITAKDFAFKSAEESVNRKMTMQQSLLDIMQAKTAVVKEAARDTPERPVRHVWEAAEKVNLMPNGSSTPTAPPETGASAAPATQSQASTSAAAHTNSDGGEQGFGSATPAPTLFGHSGWQPNRSGMFGSSAASARSAADHTPPASPFNFPSVGKIRTHSSIADERTAMQPAKRMKLDFLHPLQIVVGDGENTKTFFVPKNMIASRSSYIKDAGQDALNSIALPNHDPKVFSIYLQCVYRDIVIVDDEDVPAEDAWILLAQTYILATQLGDPVSTNLIMDEIIRRLNGAGDHDQLAPAIKLAYEHSANESKIRKAFVDYAVYRNADADLVEAIGSIGGVDFLVETVKAYMSWRDRGGASGHASFGRYGFAEDWMQYHVGTEGEEKGA